MKVLFLDIDGVLNSRQQIKALYRRGEHQGLITDFCPIACSNLLEVLTEVHDLKIVISSSWRIGKTTEQLQDILMEQGIPPERIIDCTPINYDDPEKDERGYEIQAWLDKNPDVTSFVIVDDNSDMAHLKHRLVQTDHWHGLMLRDAQRIIDMFKENKCEEKQKSARSAE